MTPRRATLERVTRETRISLSLTLPEDAPAPARVKTPVPFFSHMLEALAKHSAMALDIDAEGDIEVDAHHTVEDTGLVLGAALDQALGDRTGITRYGCFSLPMDETLVDAAIDLGGRPYLVFDLPVIAGRWVGTFDCDLVKEFFGALAVAGRMNLPLHLRSGGNCHHVIEAAFKAFARALRIACRPDGAITDVPSTKGSL